MAGRCPWWAPPLLALQFLTRLPVPATNLLSGEAVRAGLARAVGWFPLVGALIGAVTATITLGAMALWPAPVAVLLALAIEALMTGAFHEDAVADFCDAFGGGQTAEDVRRIMKDSRIGSYGTVGLLLALSLRATLMIAVLERFDGLTAALVITASACFGRWLIVALMAIVTPAPSGTGLTKDIAAGVGLSSLAFASLVALPILALVTLHAPIAMIGGLAVALVFLLCFRALLIRRIGGSTGDCLGFAAYVGQLMLLLAAAAATP